MLVEREIAAPLDSYLTSRQPATVPNLVVAAISNSGNSINNNTNEAISMSLIGAIVIYCGAQLVPTLVLTKQTPQASPAMDLFKHLVSTLDSDRRYHLIHAIANQLRYPNMHTYFFSSILLTLFAEAGNEFFQEQITRVLLERLIVHKPHPWGLLATFCELIKNPKFGFWSKSFTRMSPEITRIFESVARSCGVAVAVAPGTTLSSA